jgi:hypothetical protein
LYKRKDMKTCQNRLFKGNWYKVIQLIDGKLAA